MTEIRKPEGFQSWRSVSELASYIGVTVRTIERWWKQDKLPQPHICENGMKLWSQGDSEKVMRQRLEKILS